MDERPFPLAIRRAFAADASDLAAFRIASERERHAGLDDGAATDFARACVAYFEAELDRPEPVVFAWIAFDGALPVGTAALTLATTLPRPNAVPGDRDGRIRNVYVVPAYRRRGVGAAVVREAIARATHEGAARLMLGASADGRRLYESLGFRSKPDEMVYEPG